MYQVKHESKGEMGEFDIGAYNQEVLRSTAAQGIPADAA